MKLETKLRLSLQDFLQLDFIHYSLYYTHQYCASLEPRSPSNLPIPLRKGTGFKTHLVHTYRHMTISLGNLEQVRVRGLHILCRPSPKEHTGYLLKATVTCYHSWKFAIVNFIKILWPQIVDYRQTKEIHTIRQMLFV